MKAGRFVMRSLLDRAGFTLRGATRADCVRCKGRSRATVSFTDEVAFCHRCKWRANTVTLARELGLLRGAMEAFSAFREEARRREHSRVEIKHFEIWRETRIREVSDHYHSLSKAAIRACEVLPKFDCDEAWDALARFYHAEAQLSAAFDWLMFTKVGVWLEEDSTPVKVFAAWRRYAA